MVKERGGNVRKAAAMRRAAVQARIAQENGECDPADREQLRMLASWFEEQARTLQAPGSPEQQAELEAAVAKFEALPVEQQFAMLCDRRPLKEQWAERGAAVLPTSPPSPAGSGSSNGLPPSAWRRRPNRPTW